ncbi:glycoside hydrolase family 43 protein [Flammeovirgaceae bacterium SG7u.111]|nr:glycoside hydrolase family 43 protein [Flammeovirgaceae bacterium SG7u.132]WPO33289.1 glycoside hydrolase family 43 protein [Flammeovirgaceae bacterium SG7u.111]
MIYLKHFFVILTLFCLIQPQISKGQDAPSTFENPILSGYHPDPSICRVGDDYYMVTSTFIWYPGIPIYHSKDLVNWELIGHGINRPDQLNFDGLIDKFGVFAVTIRHHEGTFYLITTCVGCEGNFYMTATDPAGPWSDPIWLKDAPGIDPSLMWDDDGKCYYTGHTWIEEQVWPTQCGIWLQELDLEKKKLVGERKILTYGHANNASYTEGPHLYKINGNYMLMLSEGGTGLFHALSVHHSDSLWGPYVTDMINPVITHRHLGNDYPIQAIGHGDLVQTQNDEWWCVTLGKRLVEGKATFTRETFLSKIEFDGKTPVFNRGQGKVLTELERPNLPWTPYKKEPKRDEFEDSSLALKWCSIRVPKEKNYNIEDGELNLRLRPKTLDSLVNSSLLVQRIRHHKFAVTTKLDFKSSKDNEQAGMVIYRTNENHFLLLKEKKELVLIKNFKGVKEEVTRVPFTKSTVVLKAEGEGLEVTFSYGESEGDMKQIGEVQSLIVIADGNGSMFNGPGVGMYATSNGAKSKSEATFGWFEYDGE